MPSLFLESPSLRAEFDRATGTLTALHNRLTGETYAVTGDDFALVLDHRVWCRSDFPLLVAHAGTHELKVSYGRPAASNLPAYAGGPPPAPEEAATWQSIDVVYTLGETGHFIEKRLTFTATQGGALRRVVLSAPHFHAPDLHVVCYRHPTYDRLEAQHKGGCRREPGTEPVKTYFGRTPAGGFFTGVEMAFDASALNGNQVHLAFQPSLKLGAGQTVACDAAYFGVYARQALDQRADQWRPHDVAPPPVLPLPSESLAMTAMVRASFGPHRFGLVAMACAWHCQMEQFTYTPQSVAGDMKSLDFLAEVGVDWISDSHPWAGETAKMNAMIGADRYDLGELPRQFLGHAKELGIKVVQWPTMNHSHPWSGLITATPGSEPGRPFRHDRPAWLRGLTVAPDHRLRGGDFHAWPGNCLANRPFFEWLESVIFQALDTGLYGAWCMDGDFWGWGAYFHSTVPVECTSDAHDHLVGDANYACQKYLDELIAAVRQRYPHLFIGMCRPPMDLGVWSNRYADVCFTIIETGSGNSNVAGGDEIRLASRIRVHHHFFPHTMDWPLLFPSYWQPQNLPPWPSAKLDYILLSAMSSAPSMLMYFPTKLGIPAADKAEIKRWLDWGRANQDYLMVRHDLPEWPAPGRVDGSAHIIGDRGLIFLFNPNDRAMTISFALTPQEIGLTATGPVTIRQEHPPAADVTGADHGQTVRWELPPQSAVVLRIEPAGRG